MFEPIGSPPTCVEVVVTATSADWLAGFTRALVEDRLVACGQTIAPARAIFRREGKVRDEAQARVALHTRHALVQDVVARVERDHPDDVPCVVAFRVIDGSSEYLQWVVHETAGAEHAVRVGRFGR
jgi:periplasmic divalent cation tolerance protein